MMPPLASSGSASAASDTTRIASRENSRSPAFAGSDSSNATGPGIHHNPVRRGLCKRAIDWEWSSARWYAGIRPVPIEMDATLPMTYGP
jgi:hypothetical protein